MPLSRRELIHLSLLSAAAAATGPAAFAAPSAHSLCKKCAIVIDGLGGPGGHSADPAVLLDAKDIEYIKLSGMTAAHLTVGTVGTIPSLEAFEKIVMSITAWDKAMARHPDVIVPVRKAADIQADKRQKKMGLIYGLQDGVAFQDNIDRLEALHH